MAGVNALLTEDEWDDLIDDVTNDVEVFVDQTLASTHPNLSDTTRHRIAKLFCQPKTPCPPPVDLELDALTDLAYSAHIVVCRYAEIYDKLSTAITDLTVSEASVEAKQKSLLLFKEKLAGVRSELLKEISSLIE